MTKNSIVRFVGVGIVAVLLASCESPTTPTPPTPTTVTIPVGNFIYHRVSVENPQGVTKTLIFGLLDTDGRIIVDSQLKPAEGETQWAMYSPVTLEVGKEYLVRASDPARGGSGFESVGMEFFISGQLVTRMQVVNCGSACPAPALFQYGRFQVMDKDGHIQ